MAAGAAAAAVSQAWAVAESREATPAALTAREKGWAAATRAAARARLEEEEVTLRLAHNTPLHHSSQSSTRRRLRDRDYHTLAHLVRMFGMRIRRHRLQNPEVRNRDQGSNLVVAYPNRSKRLLQCSSRADVPCLHPPLQSCRSSKLPSTLRGRASWRPGSTLNCHRRAVFQYCRRCQWATRTPC